MYVYIHTYMHTSVFNWVFSFVSFVFLNIICSHIRQLKFNPCSSLPSQQLHYCHLCQSGKSCPLYDWNISDNPTYCNCLYQEGRISCFFSLINKKLSGRVTTRDAADLEISCTSYNDLCYSVITLNVLLKWHFTCFEVILVSSEVSEHMIKYQI